MSLHGGDGGGRGPVDSLGAHRSVAGAQTSFASLHGAGIARLSERGRPRGARCGNCAEPVSSAPKG